MFQVVCIGKHMFTLVRMGNQQNGVWLGCGRWGAGEYGRFHFRLMGDAEFKRLAFVFVWFCGIWVSKLPKIVAAAKFWLNNGRLSCVTAVVAPKINQIRKIRPIPPSLLALCR